MAPQEATLVVVAWMARVAPASASPVEDEAGSEVVQGDKAAARVVIPPGGASGGAGADTAEQEGC